MTDFADFGRSSSFVFLDALVAYLLEVGVEILLASMFSFLALSINSSRFSVTNEYGRTIFSFLFLIRYAYP